MKYTYLFQVWPDERVNDGTAIFDLFRMLNSRIEMQFSEAEFGRFRMELGLAGLTLREIERAPFCEPESVL